MVVALKDFSRHSGYPSEPDRPSWWVRGRQGVPYHVSSNLGSATFQLCCSGQAICAELPLCFSVPICEMDTVWLPAC